MRRDGFVGSTLHIQNNNRSAGSRGHYTTQIIRIEKESLIIAHSTTSNVPENRLRGQNLPHFPVGTEIGHCAFHVDSHKIAIVYVERIDADDFRVAVQDDGFSSREKGKRGKVVAILLFGECDDVHVLQHYLKR